MEDALKKIPPLKVYFSEDDKKEILQKTNEILSTGMLAQGKNVKEFEEAFAKYTGVNSAIAVSSGGSAIEIAMRILNIKNKDVLVPTNTFLATASGVLFAGGNPIFVDVAPDSLNVSLKNLKERRTKNTTGVILVHIGGIITPEIEEIKNWCKTNGLWLFEDCAHAHGSNYQSQMAGTFGVAGAYSFFATKVMTSGEGGMLVTNNDEFSKKAKILRDYGKPEPWVSYHTEIGANWRISDITGVIGLTQLKRLDEFIAYRQKIADFYTKSLKSIPEIKLVLPYGRCSWYKYIVLLPNIIDREKFKTKMKEKGVSLSGGVYEIPLHKQPIFQSLSITLPNADDVCNRHVCLPIYFGMTEEESEYVVKTFREVLQDKELKQKVLN